MTNQNEQEKFWSGDFGTQYIKRNSIENILPSKIHFFSKIFKNLGGIDSCLELGANIGANLLAINKIRPEIKLKGLEINDEAYESLVGLGICEETFQTSLLNFKKRSEISAASGVVIDSKPQKEYKENYIKAKSLLDLFKL